MQIQKVCARTWHRAAAAALLVALLLAATALGAAQERRVLEVWDWWGNTEHLALFEYVKEKFEARHPGVEVRFSTFPGGTVQYGERLLTAIAAGTGPDVTQASVAFARDFYEAGLFLPLNEYVEKTPELQPHQFFPTTQIYNQKDGVIFGIPLVFDTNVLFKNIDFFEEAGLDYSPHAIDTWDTFVEYAVKLTRWDANGTVTRSGYHATMTAPEWIVWIYSNGGRIFNDDFTDFDFATEQGIATVEFLLDLRARDQIAPAGTGDVLSSGRSAMVVTGAHLPLDALKANPNLRLVETTVPVGPMGSARSASGWGNMMVITANAKDPDLAWEYIKYYTSLEGQEDIMRHLQRPGAPRFDFYQTETWYQALAQNPWMSTLFEIYQAAQPTTNLLKPTAVNQIINEYFNQMRDGRIDPRSGLQEAQRLASEALR